MAEGEGIGQHSNPPAATPHSNAASPGKADEFGGFWICSVMRLARGLVTPIFI